ncbi:MAG: hypothetical protein JO210_18350 [Acidobacteriaceae bacterium]|nr:hypothetical protein [Acidobacteriaceae bacterium]
MKADRAEVSWDQQKNKWLVRIVIGEEVIRRYCHEPKNADAQQLSSSAIKAAADEGYQVDPATVVVR